jgi:glycosyltransferase involved in cell wall biosynthesis
LGTALIIAFDTFFLAERFRNVGIYEYAKNLLQEFGKIPTQDNSMSIRYFVSPGYTDDWVGLESRSGICEPTYTSLLKYGRLWRLGLVTAAAHRLGADLIFTPSPNILPLGSIPVAVTIHDAMPKRLSPELMERGAHLKAAAWVAAKLSQKIITDSEHSKKDLMEIYDLPPDKVSVVYLGYDRNTFNSSSIDFAVQKSLLTRLGIRGPYILHHGMVQLRKNVGRLIRAYELLRGRTRNLDLHLVLAGPFGMGSEQIRQSSDQQVRNGNIIFTGTLDARDLAILIKGASLCVIPSLYEGFCLPMVEAMACGVPTIVADSSCLPEVSGGVLRYFDPLSEEDMAATIEDVLDHSDLQKELARRGLKRASEFSWQRCAEETLMVLKGTGGTEGGIAANGVKSALQEEIVSDR